MLKYYLFLYLLLFLIQTYAQSTIIAKNGFEDSENWPIENFSTPPCTLGDDRWDYSTSLSGIVPSEGKYFWGIQDLNGNCGSSGFEYLNFREVNIEHWNNVILSFEVQVMGFDNGDDMKYELWFDDIPQPEEIFIDGTSDLSTNGWKKIDIHIPNTVSTLKFKISVKQNGSDVAGIDNVILTGEEKTYCSELMISEYIEGTSSLSHRNNYIELYNPGNSEIDMSKYRIVKYTGSSINYSSALALNGFLESYSTYLIEDDQELLDIEADLSTNSSVMDYNGDDKIALLKEDKIVDLIGQIGDSIVFAKDMCLRRKSSVRSPNNQFDPNEWDVYDADNIRDLDLHASYCRGRLPEIELYGNNRSIPDGRTSTSILDNTYFSVWPIEKDTIIRRSFIIKNSGNKALNIAEIQILEDSTNSFSADIQLPKSLEVNDSITLIAGFEPKNIGLSSAKIVIVNDDPTETNYSFIVQGEGSAPSTEPLMITQYYEGDANNKWIEITNISNQETAENSFYLALYWNDDTYHPIDLKPSRKKLIPPLGPGESVTFCSTLNVSQPIYALNGSEIKTSACSFTGDDILVISRSGDEACWTDRIDVVGTQGNWGTDISLVRKEGCRFSLPNSGFDPSEWLFLPIEDIDKAITGINERLGEHYTGPTIWKNGAWSNGQPDISKASIIEGNYDTSLHGNLSTCELHILSEAILNVTEDKHLIIENDLIVNGELHIKNRGSLLMKSDLGRITGKGSINIYKTALGLKPYDYTYWSSPVENSMIESVFPESPKSSFYTFSPELFIDKNQDGLDDNNQGWIPVIGLMEAGRGYTSMAPISQPFRTFQEVIFNGKPHNGSIKVSMGIQSENYENQHHWNLIGNPYPSAIDAEKLYFDPLNNGMIGATFYFWTHETAADRNTEDDNLSYNANDYAMYNIGTGGIKANPNGKIPTKFISSCQGFFVEALKKEELSFNNGMRTIETEDVFFKPFETKTKTRKIWLNLSSNVGEFSQVLIGFIPGATSGYDHKYDGPRIIRNKTMSFYSLLTDHRLAIQGLPPSSDIKNIPLGMTYSAGIKTTLKIDIDQLQGDFTKEEILLYDKTLQIHHDLKLQPYTFEIENTKRMDERFELRITPKKRIIDDKVKVAPKIVWNLYNGRLMVKTSNNDMIKDLEIFDLNGRRLRHLTLQDTTAEINWFGFPTRAIYLLRVSLSDSRVLKSKILP